MKLSEKIIKLRKIHGMSQEDLAEKINISRQTISRWECGSALPDATNIVQLSKLFNVSTDFLLNDEYESDEDIPKVKEVKRTSLNQIMIYLVSLEVMILIIQFMCIVILQNMIFGILSFIPFIAAIGGFEYAYQKDGNEPNEQTKLFRMKFYKISAWLGLYFPVRLVLISLSSYYPRPFNVLGLECIIVTIYLMSSLLINLVIDFESK